MPTVGIKGDGVAAYCCLHLLRSARVPVRIDRHDRARVPAIMLSDAAVGMIRDVFGRPELFRNSPRIQKRVVAWGKGSDPVTVPHSAIVVSETSLLESLGLGLVVDGPTLKGTPGEGTPGWTIFTSRPLPTAVKEERFGSRTASAVPVHLKDTLDSATCWIESTEDGWLFLIPDGSASAWLLSVGGPAEAILRESRLIRDRIDGSIESSHEFPAYPRIAWPLCGPEWLSCGTAALAFDPICGDGTANALREAILGCAVIRAIESGGNAAELLAHYESRLIAGFYRHLLFCRQFYESGNDGAWWQAELKALDRGLEWCSQKVDGAPRFRYQLNGFELQPAN